MNRKEFGQLVAALRVEHTDEIADRPWTQTMLAEASNLTESIVGNIERGDKVNLEPNLLVALADALQLTSRERKEFFAAAVGIEDKYVARETDPESTLRELVQWMGHIQLPALIIDSYCDLIAANSAVLYLLDVPKPLLDSAASTPAGFNIMRLVFAPESNFRDLIGTHHWSTYSSKNVKFFRAVSLRYRSSEHFAHLLSELRKFPEFKRIWRDIYFERDDYYIDSEQLQYDHPKFGPLSYFSASSMALTSRGELHLINYIPASPRTVEIFADIVREVGTETHSFASWPHKTMLNKK
jgi:hypothetical protein